MSKYKFRHEKNLRIYPWNIVCNVLSGKNEHLEFLSNYLILVTQNLTLFFIQL